MTPPESISYLVCATPRSGSTLLCEMLRATGQAGQPLEHFERLRHSGLPRQPREYFADLDDPRVLELLAPLENTAPDGEPPQTWWDRILAEGRTPNGVWGGKLMWGHVEDFLARARQLEGLRDANLEAVLRGLLGEPRLILVTRLDKVAQAVSLWRAVQTQHWRQGSQTGVEPRYDFAGIDHLRRQLEDDEQAWQRWFAQTGVEAYEVPYVQLDAAATRTVAGVLEWLGLEEVEVPPPPLQRQRDELSAAWAERYRQERTREQAA